MRSRPSATSKARLDAMVEEATVDCYNEDEQLTGLFTMIEDNLALPFQTTVLGMAVSVVNVDLSDSGQIVAMCSRDELRQAIPILDLPMPVPSPPGAEWIEAYRRWSG
jgi:Calcium binding